PSAGIGLLQLESRIQDSARPLNNISGNVPCGDSGGRRVWRDPNARGRRAGPCSSASASARPSDVVGELDDVAVVPLVVRLGGEEIIGDRPRDVRRVEAVTRGKLVVQSSAVGL